MWREKIRVENTKKEDTKRNVFVGKNKKKI